MNQISVNQKSTFPIISMEIKFKPYRQLKGNLNV